MKKDENQLYECARVVEADEELNRDLAAWDITLDDGLETKLNYKRSDDDNERI